MSLLEMKCQSLTELWQPIRKESFYYQSNAFMDVLTFLLKDAVIDNLLREGVFKNVFYIRLQ